MITFWDNLLHVGLSISVLSNCFSIWKLLQSNKENQYLTFLCEARMTALECFVKELFTTGRYNGSRVQGVAEDTTVEQ